MHFLARERMSRMTDNGTCNRGVNDGILALLDADMLPDTDTVYPEFIPTYSQEGIVDMQMTRNPSQLSHGTAPWDDIGFSMDGWT